jgi:hypothetical protein
MKVSIFPTYDSPLFDSPKINAAIKQTHKDLPRNTFGILDKETGKQYEDVKVFHLELRRISFDEWFIDKYISESADRKKNYKLLLDHRAAKELVQQGSIEAMVSFQLRTDGAFAVARLFDPSKAINRSAV